MGHGGRGEHPRSPDCRRSRTGSRASSVRRSRWSTPTRWCASGGAAPSQSSPWSSTTHRPSGAPAWHSSPPVGGKPGCSNNNRQRKNKTALNLSIEVILMGVINPNAGLGSYLGPPAPGGPPLPRPRCPPLPLAEPSWDPFRK